MRTPSILVVPMLAMVSAGCVRPDPAPRFTPAWEAFDPTGGGWAKTEEVLLIADCQTHNLYSKALPDRNLSIEAVAATAIRAPQLDLFSTDVLGWILAHGAPEAKLILHLGDALDLACEGEFMTFLDVMRSTKTPWLMAPGNHDFYYFGSYDPQDVGLWQSACFRAGAILPKDRFIPLYVAAILQQEDASLHALGQALGVDSMRAPLADVAARIPDDFEWRAAADTGGILRKITWHIDRERPWRSFILQAVAIPDLRTDHAGDQGQPRRPMAVAAILMDSCQYSRRPELIPNAWRSFPLPYNCGFIGEMLPDQLRKVRQWVEEEKRSSVIMCHHPFDALAPRTKSSLSWLWRENRIAMMVTAHTHKGYYAYHDVGGETAELELNLASTTDWPMEWRTLQGFRNQSTEQIYIQAKRGTLVGALRHQEGYFDRSWEVPLDAPDDYRKYKQGSAAGSLLFDFYLVHHMVPYWLPQPRITPSAAAERTEEQVKDTLLWTYYRLVSYFKTDVTKGPLQWPPRCTSDRQILDRIIAISGDTDRLEDKILFLEQLAAFERSRHTIDPDTGKPADDMRARFKLSQAAWASRYESAQGRRLQVEDDLIRVDWERAMRKVDGIEGRGKAK